MHDPRTSTSRLCGVWNRSVLGQSNISWPTCNVAIACLMNVISLRPHKPFRANTKLHVRRKWQSYKYPRAARAAAIRLNTRTCLFVTRVGPEEEPRLPRASFRYTPPSPSSKLSLAQSRHPRQTQIAHHGSGTHPFWTSLLYKLLQKVLCLQQHTLLTSLARILSRKAAQSGAGARQACLKVRRSQSELERRKEIYI